jgi:hypothetical protein
MDFRGRVVRGRDKILTAVKDGPGKGRIGSGIKPSKANNHRQLTTEYTEYTEGGEFHDLQP